MSFLDNKITEADLAGKGVMGQPDVPGLSAEEMQAKVEQIVREVAIVAFNALCDKLEIEAATKEEIQNLVLESGAVTSVFGRAGAVTAKEGDYTAEMIGAASEQHCQQHYKGEPDEILPEDIGAAGENHVHGNIENNGKVTGGEYNDILAIDEQGNIVPKTASELKLLKEAVSLPNHGDIVVTLEDGKEYPFVEVTSLAMTGAAVSCHGFIEFGGMVGTVSLTGFGGIDDQDDMLGNAAAGKLFEFDCKPFGDKGYIVIKEWAVS